MVSMFEKLRNLTNIRGGNNILTAPFDVSKVHMPRNKWFDVTL